MPIKFWPWRQAVHCAQDIFNQHVQHLVRARMGDREGMRILHWLPLRDLAGLASWFVALSKRSFVWRDFRFGLTRDGRIVPRESTR